VVPVVVEVELWSGKTDLVTLNVEVQVGNWELVLHDLVFLPSSG
jgi:hypothetical protein